MNNAEVKREACPGLGSGAQHWVMPYWTRCHVCGQWIPGPSKGLIAPHERHIIVKKEAPHDPG